MSTGMLWRLTNRRFIIINNIYLQIFAVSAGLRHVRGVRLKGPQILGGRNFGP